MLAEEGYDVVGQADGRRPAIELAEEHRPDLVILDVKMPVLDGIAAAERIARDRIAPVVILTAFSQRELVERARDAGAMAYLVKPFTRSDLVPAIEIAVSRFAELRALRAEVADLGERLETRKAVERAKAVLQKELGLTEPDAFRWIQKTAMDLRRSMREVAEGVVEHGVFRLTDPRHSHALGRVRPASQSAKLGATFRCRGVETGTPFRVLTCRSLDIAAFPAAEAPTEDSHMGTKHNLRIFAAVAAAGLALTACGSKASSSPTAGGGGCGHYNLAFLGATTGDAGALGQNMVGGIKLALDEYNKAHSRLHGRSQGVRLAGRPGEGPRSRDPDRRGRLDRRPGRSGFLR